MSEDPLSDGREGPGGAVSGGGGVPALDPATLRRRAKLGVLLLAARTVAQQFIMWGGLIYLARALDPGEFGIFWIVQFAMSFFSLFGDAGFGAALIQKRDEATDEELSSVFWAQLLLGSAVVLVVYVTAPWVVTFWPDLPQSSVWMLRALSLGLLLTSARVIPAILMERELLFGRLSVIDLVLTASFYGSAVVFAHRGYGPYALVAGVLVQGAAGLLAALLLRPWRPVLRLSLQILRPILRFGVPFQAKHMIGFVNAAVMPLYAGSALGRYSFGLVSWSRNTAFFPLMAIEILARVNFPLLSRQQHDRTAFVQTLERTIQVCATLTLFAVALFLGLGPSVVRVLFGDKWMPALPMLYAFAVVSMVAFISPIMNGALDALGKPQVMMRLGIGWTILNWVACTVAMHIRSGALSFTIGYCVHILAGNLAVVFVIKQLIPDTRIWPKIRTAMLAGLGAATLSRWGFLPWAGGPLTLAAAVVATIATFVTLLALVDRSALRELLAMLRNRLRREMIR